MVLEVLYTTDLVCSRYPQPLSDLFNKSLFTFFLSIIEVNIALSLFAGAVPVRAYRYDAQNATARHDGRTGQVLLLLLLLQPGLLLSSQQCARVLYS